MHRFLTTIARHPHAWVRLLDATWPDPRQVHLRFVVEANRGGRPLGTWLVKATGLLEYRIEDVDGGGVRVSGASHPVVRQYLDSRCSLRFSGDIENVDRVASKIVGAHLRAVDDWIAPDRYLPALPTLLDVLAAGRGVVCRGPQFLLRRYGAVLARAGARTTIRPLSRRPRTTRARLLHFGNSLVVAVTLTSTPDRPGR